MASTTPTAAAPRVPSTKGEPGTRTAAPPVPPITPPPQVRVGDLVLVLVDVGIWRPLLVAQAGVVEIQARVTPTADPTLQSRQELRVSGTLFCEPEDHTRPALRGWSAGGADPARISGRPDRLLPLAYGEALAEGSGLGQWRRRS